MKSIILFLLMITNIQAFDGCYKIETDFLDLEINDSKKLITLNKLTIDSLVLNSIVNYTMEAVNILTIKEIKKVKSILNYKANNYFEGMGFSVNIMLNTNISSASIIVIVGNEDSSIKKTYETLSIKSINCE